MLFIHSSLSDRAITPAVGGRFHGDVSVRSASVRTIRNLPLEILTRILLENFGRFFFAFRESVKIRGRLRLVCRAWYHLVLVTPSFWTTHDFVPFRPSLFLQQWRYNIKAADLALHIVFDSLTLYAPAPTSSYGGPRIGAHDTIAEATDMAWRCQHIHIRAEDVFALPRIVSRLSNVQTIRLKSLTISRIPITSPDGSEFLIVPEHMFNGGTPLLQILRLFFFALSWDTLGYYGSLTVLVLHDLQGGLAPHGFVLMSVLGASSSLQFVSLRRVAITWTAEDSLRRIRLPSITELDLCLAGDHGLAAMIGLLDMSVKALHITLDSPFDVDLLLSCACNVLESLQVLVACGAATDHFVLRDMYSSMINLVHLDISHAPSEFFDALLLNKGDPTNA
ncbi:hypothetical protein DFH06DRAFT_1326014 [Mycena polygramma]|nr:hypothetical protein DFH06DRAFT_1326014 [Mycena polygramma]